MTNLKLYESALIEQNNVEAPTMLIEDYNYLINKAIIQYINLTYARFDLNQQASDDLRWLQKSAELEIGRINKMIHPMEEANYVCVLPSDYFHVLGCTVHFSPKSEIKSKRCIKSEDENGIFSLCRRLTANQNPAIIQNAYLRPTYKNPYYYINTSGEGGKISAEIVAKEILKPCENYGNYINTCDRPEEITPCCEASEVVWDDEPTEASTWKDEEYNILNPCTPNHKECHCGQVMEIRCGKNKLYYPDVVYVDYLRRPSKIELTWDDINSVEDHTPECEFPDAVAYEIINIFVRLLLENAGDERLKTQPVINQTIAQPGVK